MPFDVTSIQSDEQGLRIMQVPKEELSPDAVPAKVRVTDGGRAQQDNPSLQSVGNLDWHMAKSYVKLALSLLDLENPNHEPAGSAEGGQFAEGQGTGQKKLTIRTNREPTEGQLSPDTHKVETWYDRRERAWYAGIRGSDGSLVEFPNGYTAMDSSTKQGIAIEAQRLQRLIESSAKIEDNRIIKSLNKVPSAAESGILSKVIKGERSANGYRSYWLLENGEVKQSIVALTDSEADELLNDNR